MATSPTVFRTKPLAPGTSLAIEIKDRDILLCNAEGKHYAVDNRCTHQNMTLTDGRIRQCFITCPLHGVRFDLRTGEPRGQLTTVPLKTYRVEESAAEVFVILDDSWKT